MKGGAHWAESVAHRIGIGGAVNFTPARVGQTLHVPCERGHIVDFYINARMPPEAIAKKMMQKGWTVGSHLICPKHSRKPKARKPDKEAPPQHEEEIMATPVPPAPKPPASRVLDAVTGQPQPDSPTPTVAAREARRLAVAALDEGYDVTNERYHPGWTDARIAKECGIGEAAVAKLREDMYGPLGEPAELVAMRAELTALTEKGAAFMVSFEKDVSGLRGRFEALCRKNGWAV